MLHIALVGVGQELEKLWRMVNHECCKVDKIFSVPTMDLEDIVSRAGIDIPIDDYVEIPDVVGEKYFDYILVSDVIKSAGCKGRIVEEVERSGFPPNKIIDLTFCQTVEFDSLYNVLKNYLSPNAPDYSFFVTGVSHAYAGTDISSYTLPGVNLALTSQDLFLDYELAKIFLNAKQKKLRYAIIGVAPFSLHYDLSKSVNRQRMLAYYPILKKIHNYDLSEKLLSQLLASSYFQLYDGFPSELKYNNRLLCNSMDKDICLDDYVDIRRRLVEWEEKSYPETVEENKQILRKYVENCLNHGVLPLLVVFPVTPWYNKYFSSIKFSELKNYLCDLSSEYDIPFYDFSSDSRFEVEDFFDVEHLNVKGAAKISKIVNGLLCYLEENI